MSERGTWQVLISTFVKRQLRTLRVADSFEVRNSEAIVACLQSGEFDRWKTFSTGAVYLLSHHSTTLFLVCAETWIVESNNEQIFLWRVAWSRESSRSKRCIYSRQSLCRTNRWNRSLHWLVRCASTYQYLIGKVDVSVNKRLHDIASRLNRHRDNNLVVLLSDKSLLNALGFLEVFLREWRLVELYVLRTQWTLLIFKNCPLGAILLWVLQL